MLHFTGICTLTYNFACLKWHAFWCRQMPVGCAKNGIYRHVAVRIQFYSIGIVTRQETHQYNFKKAYNITKLD